MNVLMLVDQFEDLDSLKGLKQYFDLVDDLRLTVLYISDPKSCFRFGTQEHPHYVLDDAELQYMNDLEDSVLREFLPWHERVHLRHEVGETMGIISKVIREESIDIVALSRRQYVGSGIQTLEFKKVPFNEGDEPRLVAN